MQKTDCRVEGVNMTSFRRLLMLVDLMRVKETMKKKKGEIKILGR